MANAPLTDIFMPDEKARGRLIVAAATAAAGGGGAVQTITLDNSYPPIDRSLPCPVLAIIVAISAVGAMAQWDTEGFNITGTMALAPDSAGEFLVTGDRTINFWQQNNVAQDVIVAYIAKGSGAKV